MNSCWELYGKYRLILKIKHKYFNTFYISWENNFVAGAFVIWEESDYKDIYHPVECLNDIDDAKHIVLSYYMNKKV